MAFKSIIGTVSFCLVFASITTNASPVGIVDNGAYTTQTVGSTSLDWLDLTFTDGMAYNDALTLAGAVEGGGWSYATHAQINSLFDTMFTGITYNTGGIYSAPVISRSTEFIDLFGVTYIINPGGYLASYGFYLDDSNTLRMAGAATTVGAANDYIIGPDASASYPNNLSTGGTDFGTYLVRVSAVPVPAAFWLFGSGLIGLIGIARRKVRT